MLSNEYTNNKEPLLFEKDGYKFQNSYNGFIKTDNPKKWGINNPFSIDNLKEYIKKEEATCTLLSECFSENLILKCECGKIYKVWLNNFINKKQYVCPECGRKRSAFNHRKTGDYISKIQKMGLEVYGKYEGAKHSCLFKTEEGYIIKSVPYNVVNGMEFQKTLFEISNPYTIHNMNLWISLNCEEGTKLISTEYFGAKELYTYRCSCGKEYKTNWQYFRKSDFKCPSCSKRQSSLETKVKDWLDENNINYIQQYSFNDCRNIYPLKFDFYLPLLNKIVEIDGEQHFFLLDLEE